MSSLRCGQLLLTISYTLKEGKNRHKREITRTTTKRGLVGQNIKENLKKWRSTRGDEERKNPKTHTAIDPVCLHLKGNCIRPSTVFVKESRVWGEEEGGLSSNARALLVLTLRTDS